MTFVFPYDRSSLLTMKNSAFVEDIKAFVGGLWCSDTASGDLTTQALGSAASRMVEAQVVAKSNGFFSGAPIVGLFFERMGFRTSMQCLVREGGPFVSGQRIVSLTGPAEEILKLERTLLNVLQRLCAITTWTRAHVEVAHPIRVAATRKTQWGLLDKYAVAQGGGLTHRLHLGDAPLFKENHLKLMAAPVDFFHDFFRTPMDVPFVTIEIETPDQARLFYDQLPSPLPVPTFFMFDDFSHQDLPKILSELPKIDGLYFEASGGIHLDNLSEYAHTGVDVLSVGALTHSVPSMDLSLNIL